MSDEPDLEHLQQLAAEMVLETSSLTDELTDDEARPLIAWALGQARAAASQVLAPGTDLGSSPDLVSEDASAGLPDQDLRAALADRLTPLRRTVKAINSLTADRSGLAPQLVAEELAYIVDLAGGLPEPPDQAATAGLAGTGDWQAGLDNGQFVQAVLSVLGSRPAGQGETVERTREEGVLIGEEGDGQIQDDPEGFRRLGDLSIACLILGLYLLQVTGILNLGLFDAMEETAVVESGNKPSPASTRSAGEDWFRVYFTSPRYPDDQADHHGGLDEILAADIAQARASVDVAAYDFDLETVADALLAAHERGVQVRMVTDTDNVDERAVRRLSRAGIPVVDDGRGAIMHNKFAVIDDHVVWTGSWNMTGNGTYRNNNNVVRIVSAALAQNYTVEFEEMFVDRLFGPDSPSETPHTRLVMNDSSSGQSVLVENYFAPEDAVAAKILDQVGEAGQSIRFLAFSFTDDRIGDAMKQKSKDGLVVQGVFEERGSESEYSEYGRMRRARPSLDVLTDGNPYIMHHKVIILDEEIVILGSYNFSMNADESNDENLLVVHDPAVAALYLAEFQRIYDQAAAKE